MPSADALKRETRGAAAGATAHAQAASLAAARDVDIDALKGVGITLVVIGHAFVGLLGARLTPADGWMAWGEYTLYLFHMPLFFLLCGLFAPRRLQDTPLQFLRWLALRLAWPYLLWSTLQLAAINAAGSAVNTPMDFTAERLVALLWRPTSQYWFLYALAVFHLLSYVSGRAGWRAAWLPGAVAVQVAFMASGSSWPVIGFYVPFVAWYALGATLANGTFSALLARLRRTPAAGVGALVALMLLVLQAAPLREHGVFFHSPATLGAQAAGVALVVLSGTQFGPGLRRALAWLGQRSMAIFVMHVMAVAGCRIAMVRWSPTTAPELILVASVMLGLLLPCAVAEAARRLRLSAVLGLGRG